MPDEKVQVMGTHSCAVVCHTVFRGMESVYGPAHSVVGLLVELGWNVDFIEHSLWASPLTKHTVYRNGDEASSRRYRMPSFWVWGPAKHVLDMGRTVRIIRHIQYLDFLVAVDPLNFFFSWFAWPRKRVGHRIYYSVDYAEARFNNAIMNRLYHRLDRFAVQHADSVWAVSARIADIRRQQGIPETRNVVVPNSPTFRETSVLPMDEIRRRDMVMVSNLEDSLDYDMIRDGVVAIHADIPDCRLHVVGDGDARNQFEEKCRRAGIAAQVIFHGHKTHDEAMGIVARCGIGLAIYDQKCPWHTYRDSVKIREYAALGLAVVSTPGHGLCQEIVDQGFGFIVQDRDGFIQAACSLMRSPEKFVDCRQRAIGFARRYSKRELLTSVLSRMEAARQ